MTEQQIDAELCRYDIPDEWHTRLTGRPVKLFGVLAYPTREAAFADLRQAIAASGTNAGGEA